MVDALRLIFLKLVNLGYNLLRPLIFLQPAQTAHEQILNLLSAADQSAPLQLIMQTAHRLAFKRQRVTVGGVDLPTPLILAAGFVKGRGYADEQTALLASRQENIIPGWRTLPALLGAVEFGSYTRHPRLGNPGTVLWRDAPNRSTQNRVGLKNPGAVAAAAFLAQHKTHLPPVFGINIAVTPGLNDPAREAQEIIESLEAFLARQVIPSWFTLNISCPNTEDDPGDHQTESNTRQLCQAALQYLQHYRHERGHTHPIPLWVKISPGLAESQYRALLRVFTETGISAVIATNTLGQPAPDNPKHQAGVAGKRLHRHALETVAQLARIRDENGYTIEIIGCGGISDPASYHAFARYGVAAMQYYTMLLYRGPFAPALLLQELER